MTQGSVHCGDLVLGVVGGQSNRGDWVGMESVVGRSPLERQLPDGRELMPVAHTGRRANRSAGWNRCLSALPLCSDPCSVNCYSAASYDFAGVRNV
jgi:hypothetical protein